jgi:hypothetical protein
VFRLRFLTRVGVQIFGHFCARARALPPALIEATASSAAAMVSTALVSRVHNQPFGKTCAVDEAGRGVTDAHEAHEAHEAQNVVTGSVRTGNRQTRDAGSTATRSQTTTTHVTGRQQVAQISSKNRILSVTVGVTDKKRLPQNSNAHSKALRKENYFNKSPTNKDVSPTSMVQVCEMVSPTRQRVHVVETRPSGVAARESFLPPCPVGGN